MISLIRELRWLRHEAPAVLRGEKDGRVRGRARETSEFYSAFNSALCQIAPTLKLKASYNSLTLSGFAYPILVKLTYGLLTTASAVRREA